MEEVAISKNHPSSLRTRYRTDSSSSVYQSPLDSTLIRVPQPPTPPLPGRARLVLRAGTSISRRSPRKRIQGQHVAAQRDRTLPARRPLGHATPLAVSGTVRRRPSRCRKRPRDDRLHAHPERPLPTLSGRVRGRARAAQRREGHPRRDGGARRDESRPGTRDVLCRRDRARDSLLCS